METSMINSMCRCCASEGAFKDVKTTYHWMGEEEIYADMLKDCFDISLFYPEEGEDGGICEVCITQLRNAVNFKKQVLHTEDQFKKHLQGKLFKPSIVKVEIPMEPERDSDDNNVSPEEGYSEPEYEIPIKTEAPEESEKQSKSKKRAATVKKATTSRAKKAKTEDGETSTKHARHTDKETHRSVSPTPCEAEKKLKLNRKLNFSSFVTIRPVGRKPPWLQERRKRIAEQKRMSELDWQFDNIRTILKCSNATPMRCRVGDRFACSYCLDQFKCPAELRSHSLEVHADGKPEFFNLRSLSKHIVYLDITNLKCNICYEDINGLEELMDHLRTVHDELIHKKIKNQIVPFRYDDRKILCGVCSRDIGEYNDLQDHMCEHFRNYVCRFCDTSFVIRSKMLDHKKIVHLV